MSLNPKSNANSNCTKSKCTSCNTDNKQKKSNFKFNEAKVNNAIACQIPLNSIIRNNLSLRFRNSNARTNRYFNIAIEIVAQTMVQFYIFQQIGDTINIDLIISNFGKIVNQLGGLGEILVMNILNSTSKIALVNTTYSDVYVKYALLGGFNDQLYNYFLSLNDITDLDEKNLLIINTLSQAAVSYVMEVFFKNNVVEIVAYLAKQGPKSFEEITALAETKYIELFSSQFSELGNLAKCRYDEITEFFKSKNEDPAFLKLKWRSSVLITYPLRKSLLLAGTSIYFSGLRNTRYICNTGLKIIYDKAQYNQDFRWLWDIYVDKNKKRGLPTLTYEEWLEVKMEKIAIRQSEISELLKEEECLISNRDKCSYGCCAAVIDGVCEGCCCSCDYDCSCPTTDGCYECDTILGGCNFDDECTADFVGECCSGLTACT